MLPLHSIKANKLDGECNGKMENSLRKTISPSDKKEEYIKSLFDIAELSPEYDNPTHDPSYDKLCNERIGKISLEATVKSMEMGDVKDIIFTKVKTN
jgi:hypothetical protein